MDCRTLYVAPMLLRADYGEELTFDLDSHTCSALLEGTSGNELKCGPSTKRAQLEFVFLLPQNRHEKRDRGILHGG